MKKVSINPAVVFKLDSQGIVRLIRVDLDDDELWEIDGILAEVWMAFSEGKQVVEIEKIISIKHGVTIKEAKNQIDKFIDKLSKMQLIK